MTDQRAAQSTLAYFSMEIALEPAIPTYSGGLGILAGDTLRSAADVGLAMVGVTLLYRHGYFSQRLDADGWQREEPVVWDVTQRLQELPNRVTVDIEAQPVQLRAWQYDLTGLGGSVVPVYFLDADVPENAPEHRALTHVLYGGDRRYRLCQEIILGIGGVRMLRALGHGQIERFHMNEGHASLLTLELLDEEVRRAGRARFAPEDLDGVRKRCVFTTHTPVPAGHDQFPLELVERVLGRREIMDAHDVFCCEGVLNMTYLALNLSHYVNGVAKKHGEVSRLLFARYQIDAITNGVHAGTWVAVPFQRLFDAHMPGWREDNFSLRYALSIPKEEVWQAHLDAKRALIDQVNQRTAAEMDVEPFTIGFARRATPYKRGELLFHDVNRLSGLVPHGKRLQVIYGGKAHPADTSGKEIIKRVVQAAKQLAPRITVVYLENYDARLGQLITAGVDLWLNTPQPPLEASGTSGMKAALNGVPSFSMLDGWWIEGCLEGVTGWGIGQLEHSPDSRDDRSGRDAASLYDKLEHVVLPLFYQDRDRYLDVMRHAIALNGSFFNTQRMLQQYIAKAYFR